MKCNVKGIRPVNNCMLVVVMYQSFAHLKNSYGCHHHHHHLFLQQNLAFEF